MPKKPTGFVIYSGRSLINRERDIVAIVTLRSRNVKTGDMAQVWILPADYSALHAVQSNDNSHVCGRCPLQGRYDENAQQIVDRVCYVNLGQSPDQIGETYDAGRYPIYDQSKYEDYLRNRSIRIGAYGDPAALPVSLVRYLANISSNWTGYSHQLFWIHPRRAKTLAKYLMCSCHTPAQHAEAKRRGWRSFVAIRPDQKRPDAVECPNYTHGVNCADCGLCCGQSRQAKDIYVLAHGMVGMNLGRVQQRQGAQL